jgi:hypothetical protein
VVTIFFSIDLIILKFGNSARVGPFSLCVIHDEGLCRSSGDINRQMIMTSKARILVDYMFLLIHFRIYRHQLVNIRIYKKLATRLGFARVQRVDTKVFLYYIMHVVYI